MKNFKSKIKSYISSSDTSYTISNTSLEKEFTRTASVDSIFDNISSKAHALFSILDEDHKGYLDNQILLKICNSDLNESQINDLIHHLDYDGDGKISSDDFIFGLYKLAKHNSLIRASLKAITINNSKNYLIKNYSNSLSNLFKNHLITNEINLDINKKLCNHYQIKSNTTIIQSIKIRTKTKQRLHRRILTSLFSQQTNSLLISPLSSQLFDINSIDECLKYLTSQEHLYELYHILLSENPSLSRMYETVLVDVVRYIQKSREIQSRLEKQIESERLKHSESIFRLSEEVDNQVKLSEEAARIKERDIAMKKFSAEIEAKSIQIKQLKSMIKNLEEQDIYPNEFNHQNLIYKSNEQDDSRIIKLQMKILQMNQENYNLEEQLNHIKLQLTQSRSEFNAVRHSLNNKNHELEERMTALIETVKENSALKRQVGVLQDINRKLYDANDDFYNMFESYPEWLRKEWKVEDIKPASPMIDSRFRRTSTEFKPIKSVVKKFNAHDCEANISTYASCKSDQTEELRPSSYGKGYCVMSRCDQPDCCCSKFHGNGDNGLSNCMNANEIESDKESKYHNVKQQNLWENSGNQMKNNEKYETQNKSYSIGSIHSSNESTSQSTVYHLTKHIDHENSYHKMDSFKKLNKKISTIKNIQSNKIVSDEKLRIFRIMLAGDSEVGKTSLLIRMCDDIFKNCSVTIGIDVKMKSVEVDGRKAMMQIWDTAGQERFRSVSTSFYRKADGILLVYDCTSESSFISTRDWITIIKENAGKQIPIAIIGNKKDLKEQKEWQGNKCVSYAIGSKLAQEIGALFFETSALTGENVNECLEALARLLCAQEDYNLRCPQLKLSSNDTPRQTNPKCCVR
ncbi:unnamed protein product [Schistosoma rodhaini]|uniref:EF-hand domain-containing protein n=2 Tax=Schistosoma rodhaini TaxID=6188 RepID=A0AA85FT52_9TREM|nr:unnamed protein product [Schistosoma rodhaini]